MLAEAGRVFNSLGVLVKAGDLEGAISLAWASARVAWLKGIQALAEVSGPAMRSVLMPLATGNIGDAMAAAWANAKAATLRGVAAILPLWDSLRNGFDTTFTAIGERFNEFIAMMKKDTEFAKTMFS
mgnify:CR=1 FL=1